MSELSTAFQGSAQVIKEQAARVMQAARAVQASALLASACLLPDRRLSR